MKEGRQLVHTDTLFTRRHERDTELRRRRATADYRLESRQRGRHRTSVGGAGGRHSHSLPVIDSYAKAAISYRAYVYLSTISWLIYNNERKITRIRNKTRNLNYSINELGNRFIASSSNVRLNVGLSRGSRKRGFKDAPELYHPLGDNRKRIWYLFFEKLYVKK